MIVFEYCNATLTRFMFFPKWLWILRYVIAALATISGIMSKFFTLVQRLYKCLVLTAAFVAPNQSDAEKEVTWTNMTDGWEWALGRFDISFDLPSIKIS